MCFERQNTPRLHGGDGFEIWEMSLRYIPLSPSPSPGEVQEGYVERRKHSRKRYSIHVKKGRMCCRQM